jgi:hypothetical protein
MSLPGHYGIPNGTLLDPESGGDGELLLTTLKREQSDFILACLVAEAKISDKVRMDVARERAQELLGPPPKGLNLTSQESAELIESAVCVLRDDPDATASDLWWHSASSKNRPRREGAAPKWTDGSGLDLAIIVEVTLYALGEEPNKTNVPRILRQMQKAWPERYGVADDDAWLKGEVNGKLKTLREVYLEYRAQARSVRRQPEY